MAVEYFRLPPTGVTHRHLDWYQGNCIQGRDMTEMDWRALKLYLTRSMDVGLVPMYDLLHHHNGRVHTASQMEADGALAVYAATDIQAGEPVYNSLLPAEGMSAIDVFNTYGFVDNYPQLWRWSDNQFAKRHYDGETCTNAPYDRDDCLHAEPNTPRHEVLVVSPTLVALLPSERLKRPLGNEWRSGGQWEEFVAFHHVALPTFRARALGAAAAAVLGALPTTIEEDEALLVDEKWSEEERRQGRRDVNKTDTIQAIEFRLAFKKALKLTMEVAKRNDFFADQDEM